MTWSYSGDPSDSDLDLVRFWLGDTDESDQLMQDEEIEYLLTKYTNKTVAAAAAAKAIASKYARNVDKQVDGVYISSSALVDKFQALSNQLLQQDEDLAQSSPGRPYAGGMSVADKQAVEAETDRVPLIFEIGMTDDPQSSPETVIAPYWVP